jgi:two-component system, sensor histidine kinase
MVGKVGQKPKALVAEDQTPNQKLICIHLEKLGFDVQAVSNGQEALDAVSCEPFDLIVLDMQMPQVSGYEAATQMRQQGIETPIVALTAHAMSGDRKKCLDAGCSDYLAKPFRQEELRGIVDRLCSASPAGS